MEQFNTPMMKQYERIKKEYHDCLLFFRMGDFYELFLEDAYVGSKVLQITLTSRSKGKDGRIPMAGVPYHAVDSYIAKLVRAGYKVAICEQVSEPNKYGIVDREVIRIITPGTVLDEKMLEKKENNYIMCLNITDKSFAIAAADISTGQFQTDEYSTINFTQPIIDELIRLNPAECILPEKLYNNASILKLLKTLPHLNIFYYPEWNTYSEQPKKYLESFFKVKSLDMFGLENKKAAQEVASVLLGYLTYTQKGNISHIKKITTFNSASHMTLDRSTIINLELFSTIRESEKKGSLIHYLDETSTAMGGRLLRSWIKKPLIIKDEIVERQELITYFIEQRHMSINIKALLESIPDIERILSRLSVGIGNARDLISLKQALIAILDIKKLLIGEYALMKEINKNIDGSLAETISIIEDYIKEDPRFELKEGGLIKPGINKELDVLRTAVKVNKEWIIELEKKERENTGIGSLKVRFNQVFGFYIEVSKTHIESVPSYYMRKQTLVNGERFITPELKEKEELILTAEEKINALEFEIYRSVLAEVLEKILIIQQAAHAIAVVDCIINFAYIAERDQYCCPTFHDNVSVIDIRQGRHPIVEKLLETVQFVPNDVYLERDSSQLLILTGPNMAGKSVFLRQVAIIVLLAQIGSFVPAERATLSVVDHIFVRSGASDAIGAGLSTFMVEMIETSQILNYATDKSLIIMDEIGRGTSTYDGISIAWAIAEYLVTHQYMRPKTLFATHYHELQSLENKYKDRIKNYHMAVENHKGELIFLHTLIPGGASHSHGISVAKLAGLPTEVIKRAEELLKDMEKQESKHINSDGVTLSNNDVIQKLKEIDINTITPLQALEKLAAITETIQTKST